MDECVDECMDEWMFSSKIIFWGAHYPPSPFLPRQRNNYLMFSPPFTVNKHLQQHDFMVMSIIFPLFPYLSMKVWYYAPICVGVR
jgi:hypothetical protein